MANRQEVAVFGVQQEQQTIEQYEGCVLYLLSPLCVLWLALRIMGRNRLDQRAEDTREHSFRQGGCDAFLITSALSECGIEERGATRSNRLECLPAKHQHEGAEQIGRCGIALCEAIENCG